MSKGSTTTEPSTDAAAPVDELVKCSDPIVESVRQKLLDRSNVGKEKYGVGLDRGDLSRLDWLNHLQEELLDGAGYIEAAMKHQVQLESTLITLFINFIQTKGVWFYIKSIGEDPQAVPVEELMKLKREFIEKIGDI